MNARLIFAMRQAMDRAADGWDVPEAWRDRAREWCRAVRIVATGGFTPDRIERFEKLAVPVDIYGVGSHLLSNCARCGTGADFTADIVRVQVEGTWYDMAKVGRRACENPLMVPVAKTEVRSQKSKVKSQKYEV